MGLRNSLSKLLNKLFTNSSKASEVGDNTPAPLDYEELALRQAYAESKLDKDAYNSNSGATGLFQITQKALDDYNKWNKTNYTLEDMKNDTLNLKVRDAQMENLMNASFIDKPNQSDSIRYAKALASFNHGRDNVRNALNKAKANGVDIYNSWDWLTEEYLPKETIDYINFIERGQNNSVHRNNLKYNSSKSLNLNTSNLIKNNTNMNIHDRNSLKCGGKPRKKALFGEDGTIMAAAIGVQTAMQAASTAAQIAAEQKNASMQAKSITDSATQQAKAISDANAKDIQTQEKAIQMQKDAHQDDIEQQKQIQTTLQMMAAQQNQNDIDENQKAAVKFGGKPKYKANQIKKMNKLNMFDRKRLNHTLKDYKKGNYDNLNYEVLSKAGLISENDLNVDNYRRLASMGTQSTLSYGGAGLPFKVTDGGGVIPIQVDNNGFGLYEIYGNDHEHYHKTKGGKSKTGVGFKFPDGSVVEGEGNQNSNNGELLFFTPNGAEFISKHTLRKGNKTSKFNPAEAVKQGMNPQEAFNKQEIIKSMLGLKDDGSNAKYGTYRQLRWGGRPRTKADYGNLTYLTTSLGKPINPSSIPIKGPNLGSTNGTSKFSSLVGSDFWNNYGGAIVGGAANLLTGAAQGVSNFLAGAKMANAYRTAGDKMADAYANLKTIDPSLIKDGDFDAAHALAAVQTTNLNANRDIEKIDRMGNTLKQNMKNSTLSSAALRQGFANVDDRMNQAALDANYKVKEQINKISQGNAERITEVSNENANRDTQARRDTLGYKLELAKYNNDIENEKILGVANSKANGLLQHSNALTSGFTSGVNNLTNGLNAEGQGFANAMQTKVNNDFMLDSVLLGASDANKVTYYLQHNNKSAAKALYDRLKLSTNTDDIKFVQALKDKYKFS